MFIQFDFDTINQHLNNLQEGTHPLWGEMSAKEMVVHMEDTLKISNDKNHSKIITPEDKLPLFVGFLHSEKEMPRSYKVDYFDSHSLEGIELADLIENHNKELKRFFAFNSDPNYKAIHPIYGELDFDLWCRLHQKHYTHHFKQFGLIN